MKVINLYAGPGAGKSTTAALLFAEMKLQGYNVELVTEKAKDIVWEENFRLLENSLYITASQNRRLYRLRDKVEWAVTDSPLILALMYISKDYLPNNFEPLVWELYNSYTNYNFFIDRTKPYIKTGRMQTEKEAKKIDQQVKMLLGKNYVSYEIVNGNRYAANRILKLIRDKEGEKRD